MGGPGARRETAPKEHREPSVKRRKYQAPRGFFPHGGRKGDKPNYSPPRKSDVYPFPPQVLDKTDRWRYLRHLSAPFNWTQGARISVPRVFCNTADVARKWQ